MGVSPNDGYPRPRIGEGAERWLIAAAAQRVRRKLAEAVDLAKLHRHRADLGRAVGVRAGRTVRRW